VLAACSVHQQRSPKVKSFKIAPRTLLCAGCLFCSPETQYKSEKFQNRPTDTTLCSLPVLFTSNAVRK
jgi:hypothetical protein